MKKLINPILAAMLVSVSLPYALAAGMKPETTVLFIDDENREATINIENTDSYSALLHSSLQTIPEDRNNKLIITPQLARVEAGKSSRYA
ncbi:MAG TPA: hypothetical protein DCS81_10600 [Pantoea septica]|nr:fimbria/pilus periplasmic chaperone [Pantoea sp.]HAT24747.1 hypothetical protein [Pantoea septica]